MYEHKILPFYMSYPLPMYYEQEDTVARDLEYLQQIYPTEAKKYQKTISKILDTIDYDGSLIYDEYPDRWRLYKLSRDILERIKKEETELSKENPEPEIIPEEKWEWVFDMIQILLYYEIYRRRHSTRQGFLKF